MIGLFLKLWESDGVVFSPILLNLLITQSGDFLITQDGDYLEWA
jgi:hypothetical protein